MVHVAARFIVRAGQGAVALSVLGMAAAGPAAAQQQPPSSGPAQPAVKFFIVPHSANPDDVTLFKIAQQALGDGNRFPEIFRLNQGRPRPDGTPFNDPTQIEPGQILQLPDDAQSPGVRFGPLPATPPPVTAPVTPLVTTTSSGNTLGPALASGAGGLLLGVGIGLWWRQRPRFLPPPRFDPDGEEDSPADNDEYEPHTGTLPRIPVVLPRRAPDLTPEIFARPPADDSDTQVIAAVSPSSRFRFMLSKDGAPASPAATPARPVLIIDDEADDDA
jgi:hypothetical protein